MQYNSEDLIERLVLPHEDSERWSTIESSLRRKLSLISDLDSILTEFAVGITDQKCSFFSTAPQDTGDSTFDFEQFWKHGVPFLQQIALEMPLLFPANDDGSPFELPLLLRQRPDDKSTLASKSVTLTRRQIACLLSHSFFGNLYLISSVLMLVE
jgi:hypothetical protein